MRSEYLGECATYREMPDVLDQAAFLVRRLERSELRAAAEQPLPKWRRVVTNSRLTGAHAVDFQLDPQLIDLLLDAVAQSKDNSDHLPLFQHALGRLWWLAKESASDPSSTIAIGMKHLTRALGFSDETALKDVPNEILLARILEAHAEEVLSSSPMSSSA